MIYIQILYILISSLIIYLVYQLIHNPNDTINKNTDISQTNIRGRKVKTFMVIFALCSAIVLYFEIGIDELQRGGETKLRDVLQFEKSMIHNIRQDVNVGRVPF
jgi:hypothetical protein